MANGNTTAPRAARGTILHTARTRFDSLEGWFSHSRPTNAGGRPVSAEGSGYSPRQEGRGRSHGFRPRFLGDRVSLSVLHFLVHHIPNPAILNPVGGTPRTRCRFSPARQQKDLITIEALVFAPFSHRKFPLNEIRSSIRGPHGHFHKFPLMGSHGVGGPHRHHASGDCYHAL